MEGVVFKKKERKSGRSGSPSSGGKRSSGRPHAKKSEQA